MKIYIYLALILILSFGCNENWDDVYTIQSETVNMNIWDVIKDEADYSEFITLASSFGYDSIFKNTSNTYTIFIPNNQAIETFRNLNQDITKDIFEYHLIRHFVNNQAINGERLLLTVVGKYVLYKSMNLSKLYGNFEIIKESPLYLNGKFYELLNVAFPTDNIFQVMAKHNSEFTKYITNFDSVLIDYENSAVIGINEFGDILYDTVFSVYNSFEEEFFPVRNEFRNRTATFALPGIQKYNDALNKMAQKLGGEFKNHNDIPEVWKTNVLIPYLFEHGAFDNKVEASEFAPTSKSPDHDHKLKNMLGDSVVIGYVPVNQQFCSNGYVFDYQEFSIPDSLFNKELVFEAEWLVDVVGFNKYAWNNLAKVSSGFTTTPMAEQAPSQSNDSILVMNFPINYTGNFSLEFKIEDVFPKKYLAVIGTKPIAGGIYNIYINEVLMRTFDYNEYAIWRQALPSKAGGRYVTDSKGFSKFDFWVENISQFGDVTVRFEYLGPGKSSDVRLMLDNIRLVPY